MALRDQPYLPLYVQDFLTDEKLNLCSAASQGIYIKLMCLMHKSEIYGGILLKQKFKQNSSTISNFACELAKLLPFTLLELETALDELISDGVLSLDGDLLYQKRMVHDNEISLKRSKSGSKGGNMRVEKQTNTSICLSKIQANNQANNQAKFKQNTEYEIEYENEYENINKDIDKNKIKRKEEENKKEELTIKKAIQKKEPQIDLSYINPDFIPKWERWIAYRKEIKKPLQAMSLKSAYEKLLKMAGGDYILAEGIIEQSIANGWQGLFELKTQNDNNGNINTAIASFGFATANEKANRKGGFYSARDDAANRRAEVASIKRAAEAILSEPNPEKVFAGMAK